MAFLTKFVPQLTSLFRIEFFAVSIALFVLGLVLSVFVVKKQLGWLLWYPNWIRDKLKRLLLQGPGFGKLFLLIFLINATSLLCNLVSGFGVILPAIFAILIGINVGVIAYQEGGWRAMITMFLAPHVVFELPAAWLSLALGFRLGIEIIAPSGEVRLVFLQCLSVYWRLILPLLWIAAMLEAAIISAATKKLQHPSTLPEQPFEPQQRYRSDQPDQPVP